MADLAVGVLMALIGVVRFAWRDQRTARGTVRGGLDAPEQTARTAPARATLAPRDRRAGVGARTGDRVQFAPVAAVVRNRRRGDEGVPGCGEGAAV
ncbi:hypothetical protein CURTO8I2_160044 [Curtobacterium sp. 8I-2]|nr:hypothetical protein CURTO8I2_160044 [Curtobacterium sp. 8I-2]